MSSPIADLSYRTYDGPLLPSSNRWQVIARYGLQQAFSKRVYWVVLFLGNWYFLAIMMVMFFLEQVLSATEPQAMSRFLENLVWSDQLLLGLTFSQLPLMIITLLVGAGAVSNDRRSNAILVYLSKPCSPKDYLLGKLVSVWAPIFTAMALPGVLFYAIGAMSYRDYGFLKDPTVLPKMLVVYVVASLFYSSLILGLGSMVKQGRLTGSLYAGLYLVSGFFATLMYQTWQQSGSDAAVRNTNLARLTYCSVDSIVNGFAKSILETAGSPAFAQRMSRHLPIPYPPMWLPIIVLAIGITGGLLVFWRSIRAVEVVR